MSDPAYRDAAAAPPIERPSHPIVGVIRGAGGRIVEADDTFLAIVGYTREDFESGRMGWAAMTPPEFQELDAGVVRQAEQSGGFTIPYQKELIRRDGSRVPVLMVWAFIPDTAGRWVAYVVDLSAPVPARPQAADVGQPLGGEPLPREFYSSLIGKLVTERTRTQAMLDNTDALLWAVDPELRLLAANDAFLDTQRALLGQSFAVGDPLLDEVFPPEELAAWRDAYERALAGERVTIETVAPYPPPRGTRQFSSVLCPIHDPVRGITGVTAVAQDVTDQRRAEEALLASEARFRALATASPLGVFMVDRQGGLLYANPRMREIWRVEGTGPVDMGAAMALVHPEDAPRVRATWYASLDAGTPLEQEYRVRFPDGVERHLRTRAAPLREGDRVTGFVGTVDDDTDHHVLQQRVRQSERMESLGTLAGGIAHDFNNMIGVVLGHTEMALAEAAALPGAPAALRESLDEIRTASLRARDLVRQILAFSRRTEQGHAPVDLRALVVESMRLLRPMLPASVHLDVRLPEHAVTVLGDAAALQQVLVNLSTNAEYAMRGAGGGQLTVTLTVEGRPVAPRAVLAVRDTGHGIPASAQGRLFEPFFTTKPTGEGTGMGLAVVHGVVSAHGGAITVESTPGEGATFRVALPLAPGVVAQVPEATAPPRGRGRVLLVEDEPALARFATQALTRAGFEVTCVYDGEAALRLFDDLGSAVDAVVSDVTMPGLTGDRLARELHRRHPALPIILTTGFSHLVTPESVRELGVRTLLQKPFGARELVDAVREAIDATG